MNEEYINKRAVIERIKWSGLDSKVIERVIQKIDLVDPADVAPVVHGRWIAKTAHDRRQYFECSNCGKQENKHTAIRGGFCWNCGAKMDKEETNEMD
mgnify:CR=1 FL=1